jgi:hypothetical protein
VPSLHAYFREREWQNATLCELLLPRLSIESSPASSSSSVSSSSSSSSIPSREVAIAATRRVLAHLQSVASVSPSSPSSSFVSATSKSIAVVASWAPAAAQLVHSLRAALEQSEEADKKKNAQVSKPVTDKKHIGAKSKSVDSAAEVKSAAPKKAVNEGKTQRRPSPRPL